MGLQEWIFNGIFQLNVMETSWRFSFSWYDIIEQTGVIEHFKCPTALHVLVVGEGHLGGRGGAYKDVGADLPLRGPSIESGGRFWVDVGLKV